MLGVRATKERIAEFKKPKQRFAQRKIDLADRETAVVEGWTETGRQLDFEVHFKPVFGSGRPPRYFYGLARLVHEKFSRFLPAGLDKSVSSKSSEESRRADAHRRTHQRPALMRKTIKSLLGWDKVGTSAIVLLAASVLPFVALPLLPGHVARALDPYLFWYTVAVFAVFIGWHLLDFIVFRLTDYHLIDRIAWSLRMRTAYLGKWGPPRH